MALDLVHVDPRGDMRAHLSLLQCLLQRFHRAVLSVFLLL